MEEIGLPDIPSLLLTVDKLLMLEKNESNEKELKKAFSNIEKVMVPLEGENDDEFYSLKYIYHLKYSQFAREYINQKEAEKHEKISRKNEGYAEKYRSFLGENKKEEKITEPANKTENLESKNKELLKNIRQE